MRETKKIFICSLILLILSIIYRNTHAATPNDLPVSCGKQVMCAAGSQKGSPDVCYMVNGDRWAFPKENHPDKPQGAGVYRLMLVSVTYIGHYWIAGECWYSDNIGGSFIFRSSDKYIFKPVISEPSEWTGDKAHGYYCDPLNYRCNVAIQENRKK